MIIQVVKLRKSLRLIIKQKSIYSNVVPQHSYLCPCSAAEDQITVILPCMVGAESDRPLELKPQVEQDVEFVKEIGTGSDGIAGFHNILAQWHFRQETS